PELAGDTIPMLVTVTAIQAKVVPELDDALAQKTGEAETFDELKSTLREKIEEERRKRAMEIARIRLLEKLREDNAFELPNGYIQQRTERRLNEQKEYFVRQGLSPEQASNILQSGFDNIREQVAIEVQ